MKKEQFTKRVEKLKKEIPAIHLALKHPDTPFVAKLFAGLTIAYALSPIDFIPDFIPVLGYLDDIILLPLFVALTIKFIPKELLEDCRKEAGKIGLMGKSKKWYYALPIILFWVVIIFLLLKKFGK